MEDNGTQNSNIIMQALLSIQNSILKLNDDLVKIKNETNQNKQNINNLISKIDKNEINLDNNNNSNIKDINHNLNKKEENNILAKTQLIDGNILNIENGNKIALNKTQLIKRNNDNKIFEKKSDEDKKKKYPLIYNQI